MEQSLLNRGKVIIAGAVTGLALLVATVGPGSAFAQTPEPTSPVTHEDMHEMMDAMGEGNSERMHEAMGPNAEKLMDQCVSMMGTMGNMQGMMDGDMSEMMGGNGMSGMMGMMGR